MYADATPKTLTDADRRSILRDSRQERLTYGTIATRYDVTIDQVYELTRQAARSADRSLYGRRDTASRACRSPLSGRNAARVVYGNFADVCTLEECQLWASGRI